MGGENPPDSLRKRRFHKAKKTSRSSISRPDFSRTHITSHSTTNTTAATAATTSTYYYTRTGKIDLDVERNREEAGDCFVECSGQSCQSCSATLLADCVAVCCCPLAVVSFLALAFIKVPYVMGRRCLGRTLAAATRRRKKKMIQQQMLRSKQKQCNNSSSKDDSRRGSSSSSTGSTESSGSGWKYDDFVVRRGKEGKSRDIVFEFGEMKGETEELVEQRISLCRGFLEVDSVLLELYQVGHLGFGFGRLSFSGIQGNNNSGKSN